MTRLLHKLSARTEEKLSHPCSPSPFFFPQQGLKLSWWTMNPQLVPCVGLVQPICNHSPNPEPLLSSLGVRRSRVSVFWRMSVGRGSSSGPALSPYRSQPNLHRPRAGPRRTHQPETPSPVPRGWRGRSWAASLHLHVCKTLTFAIILLMPSQNSKLRRIKDENIKYHKR